MKLIVAADNNWAIGRKQELLVRIPADMKFFREQTIGKIVVMGRKTLESFPGSAPLPKRTNIVLTGQAAYEKKGIVLVHSKKELMEELKKYNSDDIYVIGGESIYRMLLPYCDTAYVTKLDYQYDADTWMPNLDKEDGWKLTSVGEEETYFDLIYHFNVYKNSNVKEETIMPYIDVKLAKQASRKQDGRFL